MTLRTILVCLTNTHSAPALLRAAALLARRDNAHLIGLHVTESLIVYPSIAMHIPDATFQAFADSQKGQASKIKAIFDDEMRAETFPTEWRQLGSNTGTMADRIVESARAADLVVMAQEDDTHDRMSLNHLQEQVIREAGRPVLIIPRNSEPERLGEKVVLGWSATREATRAAHELVNVAASDADVRMVRIGAPPVQALGDHSSTDMATALTRHGLTVEVVHRDKDGAAIPDLLMQEAFETGADMLVTGAFGHSRSYDFVIGAATRGLLNDATLPVLFCK